jgi:hypothetical protein
MRMLWNGLCDPTLHLIVFAFLIVGTISALGLDESSWRGSDAVKRCRACLLYHGSENSPCPSPAIKLASHTRTH